MSDDEMRLLVHLLCKYVAASAGASQPILTNDDERIRQETLDMLNELKEKGSM